MLFECCVYIYFTERLRLVKIVMHPVPVIDRLHQAIGLSVEQKEQFNGLDTDSKNEELLQMLSDGDKDFRVTFCQALRDTKYYINETVADMLEHPGNCTNNICFRE